MKISEKRENSLPAMGRSMTEGGEGTSIAEVATSLLACRLGAMEELRSSENSSKGEEEGRDLISEKKTRSVLRESNSLFQPTGLL